MDIQIDRDELQKVLSLSKRGEGMNNDEVLSLDFIEFDKEPSVKDTGKDAGVKKEGRQMSSPQKSTGGTVDEKGKNNSKGGVVEGDGSKKRSSAGPNIVKVLRFDVPWMFPYRKYSNIPTLRLH